MPDFIPQPGIVIDDKYELEAKLGQGGMGSVWRAHHRTLRSKVAIKLMDPSVVANQDALTRFLREAQAAAALRSAHVVQILDHGLQEGVPYIAMEMLEGESLAQRLGRERVLPPRQIAWLMTHLARAVGRGHAEGIVHRDIKPDNIFICRNDDEEIAKLLDFGIAKAAGSDLDIATGSATKTGALLGTPFYMSPEQSQGNRSVGPKSDLWSMGVIVFECLLGRRPFESDGLGDLIMRICAAPLPVPSQWGPVPPGFDEWWARAVERDPERRFESAKAQARALDEILRDAPAPARPIHAPTGPTDGAAAHSMTPSPLSRSMPGAYTESSIPTKSNAGLIMAAVAACVLLGGGAIAAFAFFRASPASLERATDTSLAPSPGVAAAPLPAAPPDRSPPSSASSQSETPPAPPAMKRPNAGSRVAPVRAPVAAPPPKAAVAAPRKSAAPTSPATTPRPTERDLGF